MNSRRICEARIWRGVSPAGRSESDDASEMGFVVFQILLQCLLVSFMYAAIDTSARISPRLNVSPHLRVNTWSYAPDPLWGHR